MPKTNAEMVRASMARKRQRARESGLCYTCCKEKPKPGRVVCAICNAAVRDRKRRKRKTHRAEGVLRAHELEGDSAVAQSLHADAVNAYQRALNVEVISVNDRLRITEKLRDACLLGDNPAAAAPLVDWLKDTYMTLTNDNGKIVEALFDVAQQFHINARTNLGLSTLAEAEKIVEIAGLQQLRLVLNLRRISYLHRIDQNKEALQLLAAINEPDSGADALVRFFYYKERGHADSLEEKPDRQLVYRDFERALSAAKVLANPNSEINIWSSNARAAKRIGDIERAKTCFEKAVYLSREHRILWRLYNNCAQYADLLATMGRYEAARQNLLDALVYQLHAPGTEILMCQLGIPIALALRDPDLIDRCEQPDAMTFARQSANPTMIGCVAASVASLHAYRGEYLQARRLLRSEIQQIERMDDSWKLLFAIGQHGFLTDIPVARKLFEQREMYGGIKRACLSLFDAIVAFRHKNASKGKRHAAEAIDHFKALHWYGYAKLAEEFVPETVGPALTKRERQVAELVIQGMKNRAIADMLAISENTVETHVASIMNRYGIQSRFQLAEVVGKSSH